MMGLSSWAHGQTQLTNASGVTSHDVNFSFADPVIYKLQITMFDADYRDEGELIINPGPNEARVSLFDVTDGSESDATRTITIDLLNLNIQDAFNVGGANNVLRFTRTQSTTEPTDEGYGIYEQLIQAISTQTLKEYDTVEANVDAPISNNQSYALELYTRLNGVKVPIDHPVIAQMTQALDAGDKRQAASIATSQPGFLNHVIRDFAARMSTREQSINTALNDFIAMFIGVARDEMDARRLLDGQFFYAAPPSSGLNTDLNNTTSIRQNILNSNNHFDELNSTNNNNNDIYDFGAILERQNTQYIHRDNGDNDNDVMTNDDAAGVLTSRGWLEAHAIDGTNRRLVEYTVKQFACMNMEDWADATAPDTRVGRDIDRFPGGEGSKYLTTCKACHSVMDGFRGAFAHYDFDGNRSRYRTNVEGKYGLNSQTFPQGYTTSDNSWVNNARSPANVSKFGWRGYVSSGNGVKSFGTVIANSRAFSRCMTQKVYREICRRPVADFERTMVESVAHAFENSGYKLKNLFEEIAIRSECLGVR